MVSLFIKKNIVYLPKNQSGTKEFTETFLVKYEDVLVPDYYSGKKKKFRYEKQRRELYTQNNDFIIFARGLVEMIPCSEYNVINDLDKDIIITPELDRETIKHTLSSFDLREDQVTAVQKGLIAKRGVIQLPTATGKSAIITSIVKRLNEYNPNLKSLVIAPTLSTVENITKTLQANGLEVSTFGHPDKEIKRGVNTSLVQSLISQSEKDPDLLKGVGAVFYDECLPKGAMILLPDGSKVSIGEICDSDEINEVMSYNLETRTYEPKRILNKFKNQFNEKFWRVYYKNPATNKEEAITLTYNHKVYVKDKDYVRACDLKNGDKLKIDIDNLRFSEIAKYVYAEVLSVRPNVGKKAYYRYNIEVEDNHNYFADNILVSNCHHLKCDTWSHLNELIPNAEYSLGFSALSIDKKEIFNTDIRQMSYDASLIVGCSGRVLMHMDPAYYIERGIIALPIVMRLNNSIALPKDFEESQWASLVKVGVMSTPRTKLIAFLASVMSKYNRKALILVQEKDHAFTIGKFLNLIGCKFGISFGAGRGYVTDDDGETEINEVRYKYKESLSVLDDLSNGDIDILIASNHLDEGVDVPNLDAVILAGSGKKDRRIIQRCGRVLRKTKNGKYAYIFDFADNGSRVLNKQSKQRLKMYRGDIGVPESNIFDNIDFTNVEDTFRKLEGINE